MKVEHIRIRHELDATGEPVAMTWDLFPLIDGSKTRHLDERGLPRPGTHLHQGMIAVGRIGKTIQFDPDHQPSALEVHGLPFDALRAKYGSMWRDFSIYATPETSGVVRQATLEDTPDGLTVTIELSDAASDLTLSATGAKETK